MAAAAVAPLPRRPVAAAPAADLELPPVERARLEYALESAKLLTQDWPWMAADQTCVLLIAPRVQWVLNCPTAPEKFREVGTALSGKPVYAHAGDTISFNGQSMPTDAFVRALPAIANVALPGDVKADVGKDDAWIVASSLDALIGSHPAFNSGTTTEEWLSIFLHEFFHTRQLLVPSFRPTLVEMKSGKLDPAALEKTFKEDAAYRASLQHEYHILSSAAARDDALTREAARGALAQWLPAYLQRRAHLQSLGGEALVRADVTFTYVEGTARYVETHFLSDPRFHAATSLPLDSHFDGYRSFSRPGYEGLAQRKMGARYFYALGMHLGLILDHVEPDWKRRVSEQPEWIIGLAREVASARR